VRLLFVGKREPQQRDLVARPYGRFFHLPRLLAAAGDDVAALLMSHKRTPATDIEYGGVRWKTLVPASSLLSKIEARAHAFRPDWIIGMSDACVDFLASSASNGQARR
jgi:hypothetical protein